MLAGCICVKGVDEFLNVAQAYVLGRPADDMGRANYNAVRPLAAPDSPAFPFAYS